MTTLFYQSLRDREDSLSGFTLIPPQVVGCVNFSVVSLFTEGNPLLKSEGWGYSWVNPNVSRSNPFQDPTRLLQAKGVDRVVISEIGKNGTDSLGWLGDGGTSCLSLPLHPASSII